MASSLSLRRQASLVWRMGIADFLLKYRGSVLGYLWSLLAPLSKFLVIFAVLHPLLGGTIPFYPLYLFLGIIVWEHFANTTLACMGMLQEKAALIRQVTFPRLLLALTVGWTQLLVLLSHIAIFCLFAVPMGVRWTGGILYLPAVLLQAFLLSLGVGMLLSAWSLKYRDIRHIWEIVLQVLFWLTPVLYSTGRRLPLTQEALDLLANPPIHSPLAFVQAFTRFQPVSILIDDARRVLIYDGIHGVPSLLHAAVFTLICLAVFLAGAAVFHRRSRYFLEEY